VKRSLRCWLRKKEASLPFCNFCLNWVNSRAWTSMRKLNSLR
jgi:hypothetical protein